LCWIGCFAFLCSSGSFDRVSRHRSRHHGSGCPWLHRRRAHHTWWAGLPRRWWTSDRRSCWLSHHRGCLWCLHSFSFDRHNILLVFTDHLYCRFLGSRLLIFFFKCLGHFWLLATEHVSRHIFNRLGCSFFGSSSLQGSVAKREHAFKATEVASSSALVLIRLIKLTELPLLLWLLDRRFRPNLSLLLDWLGLLLFCNDLRCWSFWLVKVKPLHSLSQIATHTTSCDFFIFSTASTGSNRGVFLLR